jgi:hypothetical protein
MMIITTNPKELDYMNKLVLHLKAPCDINGNPKRLFVVTENGEIQRVINEGHAGVPADISDYPRLTINIPAGEYRRWRKRVKYDNN